MIVQLRSSAGMYLSYWAGEHESPESRFPSVLRDENGPHWIRWEVLSFRDPKSQVLKAYIRHADGLRYLTAGEGDGRTMTVETQASERAVFELVELAKKNGNPCYALRSQGGRVVETLPDYQYRETLVGNGTDVGSPSAAFEFVVQPYSFNGLEIGSTTRFEKVWWDRGSGASKDVTFWRPVPPTGFQSLGDIARPNFEDYNDGRRVAFAVRSGSGNAVANPIRYDRVWDDAGSGAYDDVVVWRPIPPDGYVALGLVTTNGAAPAADAVACVRRDLVVPGAIGDLIWDDAGSRANRDFGAWGIGAAGAAEGEVRLSPGTFVGVSSHTKPEHHECAWNLRLALQQISGADEPTKPAAADLLAGLPEAIDKHAVHHTVYLPWFAVTDPDYSDAEKLVKSPAYRLEREDRFERVLYLDCRLTAEGQEDSITYHEGFSEESVHEFQSTTGISVGAEIALASAPLGIGAEWTVNVEVSQSFTYGKTWARSSEKSTEISLSLKVPAGKVGARYLIKSQGKLFRQDGTLVATTTSGCKPNSSLVVVV